MIDSPGLNCLDTVDFWNIYNRLEFALPVEIDLSDTELHQRMTYSTLIDTPESGWRPSQVKSTGQRVLKGRP